MSKEPKQLDLFIPDSEESPPFTNRGVTVSIHWLSMTYFTNPAKAMTHFLNHFYGYGIEDEMEWSEFFQPSGHGARLYSAMYFGPNKTTLYAYPDTGRHCHLEMKGEFVEQFGNKIVIDYLKSLFQQEYESRCTRIDIAFDHVPFTPMDCYQAWQEGNVIAKCHHDSWDWRENSQGNTLYIGSRQSDRFIRIYDRRGFTRLEMVFKDKWAENFAKVITEIPPQEWILQCIGYLRDYVNFIDRTQKKLKNSDYEMLSWWAAFVCNAEKIKLDIVKKDANENLKRRMEEYLERLLPTLYVIRHGLNLDINKLIDSIENSLSQKHLRKLELIRHYSDGETG